MEWPKDKTLKLIELLQVNPSLWNTSICDTRRDKRKRKEELCAIADILGISIHDTTKKIQHLRTQYNRELARETRLNVEDPNDRYISNWYAFEYLHFMKDSNKPYRLFQSEEHHEVNGLTTHSDNSTIDCKLVNLSPSHKIPRTEVLNSIKPEIDKVYSTSPRTRDEFSVFGEYIANELRSLKGEKNLLIAKKKIQDVIFEVKIGMMSDERVEPDSACTVYSNTSQPPSIHAAKLYTTPVMSTMTHIEPLSTSHTPPTTGISEIIINGACHYSNFKVDNQ